MSTHYTTLQAIASDADTLAQSEATTVELKRTAEQMHQALQPCMNELKQAAANLAHLLQPCQEELDHAFDVWESKINVRSAIAADIWEEIGTLTGVLFQAKALQAQMTEHLVSQAGQDWDERVKSLEQRWFIDKKGGNSKSVNPTEVDKFLQQVKAMLKSQTEDLGDRLTSTLTPLAKSLSHIGLKVASDHINLLDSKEKAAYQQRVMAQLESLESLLQQPLEHLPAGTENLAEIYERTINQLADQTLPGGNLPGRDKFKSILGGRVIALMPITWEQFSGFTAEISELTQTFVRSVIEHRVASLADGLENLIRFYDAFLEKQQRYEQESEDQRLKEKVWITNHAQQFIQLQEQLQQLLI